jgi:type VI protein secretion system component VasK
MPSFAELIEWFIQPGISRIFVIGLIVYLLLLWAALIIWTTKDVISRTNNIILQIISIILVVVLNIFGILIYLAIRPTKTIIEKFFEDLEYEALSDSIKNETKQSNQVKQKKLKKKKKLL